jgi:hypothetical protein
VLATDKGRALLDITTSSARHNSIAYEVLDRLSTYTGF